MKSLVVDASVCLKWIFDDEENREQALRLLRLYINDEIALVAPDLWVYEVTNGIKSALLSRRVSYNKAKSLLKFLMTVKPNLFSMQQVMASCLANSYKFRISIYDSCYVTLAMENGLVLISGDNKLVENVGNEKIVRFLSSSFDILDSAGTFKPKKAKTVLQAREKLGKGYNRF